ncbi:hypothetical protein C2G38_2154975 [Gigaspora rosea]|uniref:Uncharacterized protein n=1 Tax=Gigaspora rosea TaxID=44941 RepID=A0A397W7R3_9GLOM|nr:hypothetical protein C2G38_2154975 [Gigaspora rosea]
MDTMDHFAETDNKRKLNKLEKEEINPKEKIVDSRTLGKSDCEILVKDNDKVKKEEKEHTESELAEKTFDLKEWHSHIQSG